MVTAPSPPGPPQWPEIGEFNVLEASIGKRGKGKSTHQCVRALELQRAAGGAYVIGHSLGQRLPDRLPDGVYGGIKLQIVYHSTIESLHRGLMRNPGKWHILAPPLKAEDPALKHRETADDLLEYAMQLSVSIRRDAWRRAHPLSLFGPKKSERFLGLKCPPIIVIIDEGIAVESAAPGHKARQSGDDGGKMAGRDFLEMIYSLRHLHMGLLYAIQEPTSRSWRVLESATAIHCFRLSHQWALQGLQAAGATPEQIDIIRKLPKYQHVTMDDEDETPATVDRTATAETRDRQATASETPSKG